VASRIKSLNISQQILEKTNFPKKVFFILLSIVLLLLVLNICGILLWLQEPESLKSKIFKGYFDFNQASSIPTYFITAILLMSTILLITIGIKAGKMGFYWYGLSFILGLLTASKAFHIQKIIFWRIYKMNYDIKVPLFVIGILLALSIILFFVIYIPFFSKLPKHTLKLVVLSLFVFVLGAVIFDKIGTWYTKVHGFDLGHYILYTIEETMEMIGTSLFVFGCLKYLIKEQVQLNIEERN
jgi:hypothetical protein